MFRGKTAIVTGAGRGIGRETALLMAAQGANVVVNDLGCGPTGRGADKSVARTVVTEIRDAGGTAVASCSDIGTWTGCQAVVNCAVDNFGRIDYLINNAGIIRPVRIWDMEEDDVDVVVNVCLKGCIAMVRYAAEHLKKRGGVIVNVSSHSGLGMYAASGYGAAKEGVVGFTRCIARDLGEFNVRCHSVRPLTIDSNMVTAEVFETVQYHQKTYQNLPVLGNQLPVDGGSDGTSANVAAALAWLCTPYAEPLNGREVYIHGGFISLYQEPEQVRARANPGGWTFDALCSRKAVESLTIGQFNPYKKKKQQASSYDFYDDASSTIASSERKTSHHHFDDASTQATEELTACSESTGCCGKKNCCGRVLRPPSAVHFETNNSGGGSGDNRHPQNHHHRSSRGSGSTATSHKSKRSSSSSSGSGGSDHSSSNRSSRNRKVNDSQEPNGSCCCSSSSSSNQHHHHSGRINNTNAAAAAATPHRKLSNQSCELGQIKEAAQELENPRSREDEVVLESEEEEEESKHDEYKYDDHHHPDEYGGGCYDDEEEHAAVVETDDDDYDYEYGSDEEGHVHDEFGGVPARQLRTRAVDVQTSDHFQCGSQIPRSSGSGSQ